MADNKDIVNVTELVDALLSEEVEHVMGRYAAFGANELDTIAEEIEKRGPSARSATHLAAACRPGSLGTLLEWVEFGDPSTRGRSLDAVERLAFAFPKLHGRILESCDKIGVDDFGLTSKWCRILSTMDSPGCRARLKGIGSDDAILELASLGDISVIGASPSVDRELANALSGQLLTDGREPSIDEIKFLLRQGKMAGIWNLIEHSVIAEDMKSILRNASGFARSRSQMRFAKRIEAWVGRL